MPPRFRKKIRTLRGSRTCGWGRVAQHRGSGQRGGYGHAGGHKHMWSRISVEDPDHFGKKGFRRVKFIHQTRTLDLEGLSNAIGASGNKGEVAEKKTKINVVELGYEKVLGKGRIDKPVVVEALSFSKIAKQKIESAGGKTVIVQR